MAHKKARYTDTKNPMQDILEKERRKAMKALKEVRENDGIYSKATNEWLLTTKQPFLVSLKPVKRTTVRLITTWGCAISPAGERSSTASKP